LFFGLNKKLFNSIAIRQFSFNKFHALRKKVTPTVAQIIENKCLMTPGGQKASDSTTYIPRPPSDQYLHKKTIPSPSTLIYLESITVGPVLRGCRPPTSDLRKRGLALEDSIADPSPRKVAYRRLLGANITRGKRP
jgi:hypothetical protein